jgi:fumarylpyruvate hydrolase
MSDTALPWSPPPAHSLPVRGRTERLPVHRPFFVGRNCHAHAVEMGRPVDKAVERSFYFTKAPSTLVPSGATEGYPPETQSYQPEMELVLAIGAPCPAGRSSAGRP